MPQTTSATVRRVIRRTPCVKSFVIAPDQPVSFRAGQYMVVTAGSPAMGKPLSISSAPLATGELEFTKKITQSPFSALLDGLGEGDRVDIRLPFGSFTLDRAGERTCFLAGGIGITPIISMCRQASLAGRPGTITVLYGNRTAGEIAFFDEFSALEGALPGLRVVHVLQEAPENWAGRRGFITAEVLRECVPELPRNTFFVCGPPAMVDAMKRLIRDELQLPEESLVLERFSGY